MQGGGMMAKDGTPFQDIRPQYSTTCLLVTGIDRTLSEYEYRALFLKFGPLKGANYRRDFITLQPQGSMYIDYMFPQDAWQCKRMLHHRRLEGSTLFLEVTESFKEIRYGDLIGRQPEETGLRWISPRETHREDWPELANIINPWNGISSRPWCTTSNARTGDPRDDLCRLVFPEDSSEWFATTTRK